MERLLAGRSFIMVFFSVFVCCFSSEESSASPPQLNAIHSETGDNSTVIKQPTVRSYFHFDKKLEVHMQKEGCYQFLFHAKGTGTEDQVTKISVLSDQNCTHDLQRVIRITLDHKQPVMITNPISNIHWEDEEICAIERVASVIWIPSIRWEHVNKFKERQIFPLYRNKTRLGIIDWDSSCASAAYFSRTLFYSQDSSLH